MTAWSSRAVSWRVALPLVPLAVISAAAVSAVALVVCVVIAAVAVQLARAWATVALSRDVLVVRRRLHRERVPIASVQGVRVLRVTPTRLVPVVDRDGAAPIEVVAAQELLGSASVLQPRSWGGRADRFARVVAEAAGLERLDEAEGGALEEAHEAHDDTGEHR